MLSGLNFILIQMYVVRTKLDIYFFYIIEVSI